MRCCDFCGDEFKDGELTIIYGKNACDGCLEQITYDQLGDQRIEPEWEEPELIWAAPGNRGFD